MGTPPDTTPNWTLLDPHDNDTDNGKIRDVLCKLVNTHKKVRYYRKLSIKHLRKFMKDQPVEFPNNTTQLLSWRAAMYQHAQFNAIFFMRRDRTTPAKPRYCMTVGPVGNIAEEDYSAALDELNALAWNFQQYNVDGSGVPLALEILSTHNKTVNGVPNCPTDDPTMVGLYQEAVTAQPQLIHFEGRVLPTDPDYDTSYDNEGDPVFRWTLHPTQPPPPPQPPS